MSWKLIRNSTLSKIWECTKDSDSRIFLDKMIDGTWNIQFNVDDIEYARGRTDVEDRAYVFKFGSKLEAMELAKDYMQTHPNG